MSLSELLILLLPLLIAAILVAFFGFRSNARGATKLRNLPPGKLSRMPLVGEALSFFKPRYSPFVGDFFDQRVHNRYGNIFKMNLFGEPTIVSLDKEFSKFVLRKENAGFVISYPKSMLDILGNASLGFQTGALHLMLRSILDKFVKGNNLRTYLLPLIDREASLILDSWRSYSSLSVVEECKKFAFNMTMKYVLNMGMADEELKKLRTEYDTFVQGFFVLPLNIPGTTYRRALQSRSVLLKIFKRKLEELSKDKDEDRREGFASNMAEANLTMDQVLDTLLGVGFAGYTTASITLPLAIYFLQSCPNAIKQLQEEHMAITEAKKQKGERTLTWLDYKQMEFTHCVTNETLRLGTFVTLLFRRAIRDVSYKDFDIPNGWKVIAVTSSAHRDPSVYEDPPSFNPWRWKARSTTTNDENMMPFGYGPRLCPGAELSKVAIAIFLHHLVLRYDWEPVKEDNPMFFPYVDFPKGFPIKVSPIHK